jgi:type IV secretory pathway TraG/TraD family ATPase VirD4
MKLSKCKNPIIKQFWMNAEQTTGDQSLANFVPYLTSKFDNFISNDIMRPVVLQEKSVFDFREIMDNKKILLVNLSKGRLGEINANLIGMLLVGKIQMAALSRVDMYGQKMEDFFLYIDEFQNVTTDSIESILSEARKYRLSLTVAHQYISQLEDNIKNAVFGNVGSLAVFRVGAEDAEFLESKFKPVFTAKDIMKIDNRNAYVSMLINGQPTKPFNIATFAPPKGNMEMVQALKELSYLKYGRDREEVENEIMDKYRQ